MKIFSVIAGTGRYITPHTTLAFYFYPLNYGDTPNDSNGTNVFLQFPPSPLSVNVSQCLDVNEMLD